MKNQQTEGKVYGQRFEFKGSVMTPLNWMVSIVEGLLLSVGAFNHTNWFGISSFILAVLMVIFYCCVYLYFAKKDPDRLQTEKFNLQIAGMEIGFPTSTKAVVIEKQISSGTVGSGREYIE